MLTEHINEICLDFCKRIVLNNKRLRGSKMKILYVTTISNTVNAFLIPYINMLVNLGHHVDVAFKVEREVKHEIYKMGCKVYDVPFHRLPFNRDNFKAYKRLKAIIIAGKYDLVHTHTPVASAIVRLASRNLSNLKIIYTAHGFHFFKGAPLINWLIYYPIEKWLSRYTDVLITINQEDYDAAIKGKFKSKQVVLVNGVGINLERFKPQIEAKKLALRKQYGYTTDDFILIYAGELSYRKHQDLLINVAGKLKDKIPNLKIILAGSGELEEQYNNQIKGLGVQNQVELLGFRKDINNLMNLADIAVSASRQEGLPVNVMEAMATGLPLIVTDCRGNRDLVSNNGNGFVVKMDDIGGFAAKVMKLYKSRELREKYGGRSIELIENYSIDNIINEVEFIETVEGKIGKKATKEYLPMRDGDVPKTYARVDDLIEDVGFKRVLVLMRE